MCAEQTEPVWLFSTPITPLKGKKKPLPPVISRAAENGIMEKRKRKQKREFAAFVKLCFHI